MTLKHYTVEQIVKKLREAEVEAGRGGSVGEVCRKIITGGDTVAAPDAADPGGTHPDVPKRQLLRGFQASVLHR